MSDQRSSTLWIPRVHGEVRYPDHPEHVGAGGVVGGEPVVVRGLICADSEDAMDWARAVLDGIEHPEWSIDGELLDPHTDPVWVHAFVTEVGNRDPDSFYLTTDTTTRNWLGMMFGGEVITTARTDPDPAGSADTDDDANFAGEIRGMVRDATDASAEPYRVNARRTGFASKDAAMNWCRRALDGAQLPSWSPVGDLPEWHTDPVWESAFVEWVNPPRPTGWTDEEYQQMREEDDYWTAEADDRRWFVIKGHGVITDLVRTDPSPEQQAEPAP